jgi:hypothetical protein
MARDHQVLCTYGADYLSHDQRIQEKEKAGLLVDPAIISGSIRLAMPFF